MSAINKNYKVEYIDNLPIPNITDITDSVISLDSFVLQSTGIIAEAKLTLNAEFGAFITDDNGGTTPILSNFDRIRITIIGDDGVTEQKRIFEITTNLSQLATRSSHFLPLELEGRERNLSGVPFSGFFRDSTHLDIIQQILFSYRDQIGTSQPTILGNVGDIPNFNPNIWDFTQVDNCYDALLAVLDSLNLPVSAGGGGNRFALIFEEHPTDINLLVFKIMIQGTNNVGSIPTLQQNDTHPITKIDEIKQASTGTIVVARGRAKTGTMPTNYNKFTSLIEFYKNIRPYNATITYPKDAFVTSAGTTFQANQIVPPNTAPPLVGWTPIGIGNFIGLLQYSPFTNDKLTPFKNGLANPTGSFATDSSLTFGHIAIPDHNLFINDRSLTNFDIGTYRNWVTFRTKSVFQSDLSAAQKAYMFPTVGGFGFFEGFTILIDDSLPGTLEPPFDGSDSNGIPFKNSVAKFVATKNLGIVTAEGGSMVPGGEWIVVRKVEEFDQTAIYNEARVYEFNSDDYDASQRIYPGKDRRRGGTELAPLEWQDISGIFLGNDCFHTPSNIEQVDGLFGDSVQNDEPLKDPTGTPYIEDSAIKITFGYNASVQTPENREVWFTAQGNILFGGDLERYLINLIVNTYNAFLTPKYTNIGWWFAWPSPYPFSTSLPISEKVGELYGGDQFSLNVHRYFDLYNVQFTTTGKQGWIFPDSSDLTEVTGVQFLFKFDITIDAGRIPLLGDIPFTYWCIDSNGTRWKSKRIFYRHLGEIQLIQIEFGDLSPVFSTRTQLGIDNLLVQITRPEIEVNEIFFKDKIIMQGFQCEAPYDEFGRYSPNLWEQIVTPATYDAFKGGTGNIAYVGTIDAFSFIKTPIAISKSNALSLQRTIIPTFEDYQNIVNVEQLQRFADSMSQIEQFQYEQYTIEQGGIVDLDLEDSIFLHDPSLINEEDDVGNPNTRLLAVRELHYSVPFQGGLIRKIVGVKVIV